MSGIICWDIFMVYCIVDHHSQPYMYAFSGGYDAGEGRASTPKDSFAPKKNGAGK